MVFSSTLFLFIFLPFAILGYYALPKRWHNAFLLLASFIFLGFGSVYSFSIMLCSIVCNYLCGLGMHFAKTKGLKTFFLGLALTFSLGLLGFFKYTNALLGASNVLFGTHFETSILLPIGISFFIFQGLSYVIDLFRGEVGVQKNPFTLALYIALFPQLIAGPIVRYDEVEKELASRNESVANVYEGLQRFIVGISKKMLLANPLATVVDPIFADFTFQSPLVLCFALCCYGLQIYFDFSGYSDMAIGLGRVFGFHFGENFNLPYISRSMREFWRRWHISLSTWFRDYLYIPLGGSQKGNEYVHLLVVFVATGVWHGASLRYLIWGLWHGLFLTVEHALHKKHKFSGKPRRSSWLGMLYANAVVLLGWLFFRANTTAEAFAYLKQLFNFNMPYVRFSLFYYLTPYMVLVFAVATLIAFGLPQKLLNTLPSKVKFGFLTYVKPFLLLLLFALCIVHLVNGTFNPFIYFQF